MKRAPLTEMDPRAHVDTSAPLILSHIREVGPDPELSPGVPAPHPVHLGLCLLIGKATNHQVTTIQEGVLEYYLPRHTQGSNGAEDLTPKPG